MYSYIIAQSLLKILDDFKAIRLFENRKLEITFFTEFSKNAV